ncbi:TetR/AcrR family transcriptional regulator, partial [Mesorhizobium sp. M8A.F.Ca.ET.059.01.1.1]
GIHGGPAVLGRAAMDAIDNRHGNRSLREGLVAAMRARSMTKLPAEALTALLGSAFDRAALAIEAGASAEDYRAVLMALIDGLSRA